MHSPVSFLKIHLSLWYLSLNQTLYAVFHWLLLTFHYQADDLQLGFLPNQKSDAVVVLSHPLERCLLPKTASFSLAKMGKPSFLPVLLVLAARKESGLTEMMSKRLMTMKKKVQHMQSLSARTAARAGQSEWIWQPALHRLLKVKFAAFSFNKSVEIQRDNLTLDKIWHLLFPIQK